MAQVSGGIGESSSARPREQESPPSPEGISGSLDAVAVSDVLQFIHLGERTGTLVLKRREDGKPTEARIGFQNGRLIGAQGPDGEKLGDFLIEEGLVPEEKILEAVRIQGNESPRRLLGQVLVERDLVDPADLSRLIVRKIESTVSRVALWNEGTFQFVFNDLGPIDDIALHPSDVVPEDEINTQMVLLEATRIFDERNREFVSEPNAEKLGARDGASVGVEAGEERPEGEAEDSELRPGAERSGSGSAAALASAAAAGADSRSRRLWVDVVSFDPGLAHNLCDRFAPELAYVGPSALPEVGSGVPADVLSAAVLDLRQDFVGLEEVRNLRRASPGVAVLAVVEPGTPLERVYGAGAVAAVPAETEAIQACLESLLEHHGERPPREAPEAVPSVQRATAAVARLRRVHGDLRSGRISATVALNLLHLISDSVERAVLFLVKEDSLLAVGAFGLGAGLRPLAEATRGYSISLTAENSVTDAYLQGEAQSALSDESGIPEGFMRLVGRPHNGHVVIFPVLGVRRVIAVIYADNGHRAETIEDIEILEMATAQVGMAFENELLRRKLA